MKIWRGLQVTLLLFKRGRDAKKLEITVVTEKKTNPPKNREN